MTGNQAELCGAGNRIQVYKDNDWYFPSEADWENALLAFNATLGEALAAASEYLAALDELAASQLATRDLRAYLP